MEMRPPIVLPAYPVASTLNGSFCPVVMTCTVSSNRTVSPSTLYTTPNVVRLTSVTWPTRHVPVPTLA